MIYRLGMVAGLGWMMFIGGLLNDMLQNAPIFARIGLWLLFGSLGIGFFYQAVKGYSE
jgi:hypothetical protein